MGGSKMRVINISSVHRSIPWARQFPDNTFEWDGWRFIINAENEDYDYLVVCHDLHAPIKPNCAPEKIILAGSEPPAVWKYQPNFLKQFAWVITQDTRLKHPARILYQPGIPWYIGWRPDSTNLCDTLNYRELETLFNETKTKLISVIASDKKVTPIHIKRLEFAHKLKAHYGKRMDFYGRSFKRMGFYGRGFTPMDDKLDALKEYRFSVVLENSNINHYFTEKFTDCVIAGTYPIYFGCPNLEQYFPQNSFVRININRFASSVKIIDNAIEEEFDKKYRQPLQMARDLAMRKHNLFPMLIDIIKDIEAGKYGKANLPRTFGGEMLPFGHQKFRAMFGPKYIHPFRKFLRQLANNYAFFNFLRAIYRKLKLKSSKGFIR